MFILVGRDNKIIVVGKSTAHLTSNNHKYGDLVYLYRGFGSITDQMLMIQAVDNLCMPPIYKNEVLELVSNAKEQINKLVGKALVIPLNISNCTSSKELNKQVLLIEKKIGDLVIFGQSVDGAVNFKAYGARNPYSHRGNHKPQ